MKFIKYLLPFLNVISLQCMDTLQVGCDLPDKIHGIMLKVEMPCGNSLHFVPSYHSKPLSDFTLLFQKEIFQCSALILERLVELESGSDTLAYIVNFINQEFIEKELDGFVKSDQDNWSLDFDDDIRNKYENIFKQLASILGNKIDCSHFHNIYVMKPGVVLAIFKEFSQILKNKSTGSLNQKGMDNDISDWFESEQKPILGLETMLNLIHSFSFSTKKLEDIIDDFKTEVDKVPYFNSLEEMHYFIVDRWKEKRLSDEANMAIRNKSWLNKYSRLAADYPGSLGVNGAAHFFGSQGIIKLGQDLNWMWYVLQEDGQYRAFTYDPTAESPFLFCNPV